MGYEKGITKAAAVIVINGYIGPRAPSGPHGDSSAEGGSVNHEALAHAARVAWALNAPAAVGSSLAAARAVDLRAATAFYDYQIQTAFMSRKNAVEQTTPSHTQWHLHAATLLLLACWRFLKRQTKDSDVDAAVQNLATNVTIWLGMHHAICRVFAVSIKGKWAIVSTGARAWPHEAGTSMDGYTGRNWTRDTVFAQIEGGALPKAAGLARSDWPQNLDLVAVAAVQYLKAEFPDVVASIRNYSVLPPLEWPIAVARKGGDFVTSLPQVGNTSNLPVQRWAAFVDGVESYGIDQEVPVNKVPAGAMVGVLNGREDVRQIFGGAFRRKEDG